MQVYILKGEASYAKILGPARANNFGEVGWEFDVVISPEETKRLLKDGFPKAKIKHDDRGNVVGFKRRATRMDGSASKPYTVYDAYGDDWPSKTLIGNGSKVQVKYMLREGKKGLIPEALEVVVSDHVPYVPPKNKPGGFEFKEKSGADSGTEAPWTETDTEQ